jgi:organic hydroperoxide reductase OsmC/OhrA
VGTATSETEHRARVVWRGDKRDLRAHEIQLSEQTLAASCAPARGGDPSKADPEELFVAALSACHMLWFLYYARSAQLRVISYEDEAEGTVDGDRFVSIVLQPCVKFQAEVSQETLHQLHDRAHEACFIANSVNCQVLVNPRAGTSGPATKVGDIAAETGHQVEAAGDAR